MARELDKVAASLHAAADARRLPAAGPIPGCADGAPRRRGLDPSTQLVPCRMICADRAVVIPGPPISGLPEIGMSSRAVDLCVAGLRASPRPGMTADRFNTSGNCLAERSACPHASAKPGRRHHAAERCHGHRDVADSGDGRMRACAIVCQASRCARMSSSAVLRSASCCSAKASCCLSSRRRPAPPRPGARGGAIARVAPTTPVQRCRSRSCHFACGWLHAIWT